MTTMRAHIPCGDGGSTPPEDELFLLLLFTPTEDNESLRPVSIQVECFHLDFNSGSYEDRRGMDRFKLGLQLTNTKSL
jgi:hypothetical protein